LKARISSYVAREISANEVSRAQVGQIGDVVGERRAARARILARPEHEVVDDQLPPPVEQIGEPDLAVESVELVVLLDRHHRQPPALGGERVERACGLFLLDEQLVAGRLPLGLGDDVRQSHVQHLRHRFF